MNICDILMAHPSLATLDETYADVIAQSAHNWYVGVKRERRRGGEQAMVTSFIIDRASD